MLGLVWYFWAFYSKLPKLLNHPFHSQLRERINSMARNWISAEPCDTTDAYFSRFQQRLHININTSGLGLGRGLCQFQDEKLWVIGFGSRKLVSAELKHHSSKVEFLVLKWAVCEHFRDYLFYVPHFGVYTDYTYNYNYTYSRLCCVDEGKTMFSL